MAVYKQRGNSGAQENEDTSNGAEAAPEADDEDLEVELDDDDPEDDGGDEEPPEDRQTRTGKKINRWKDHTERTAAAEEARRRAETEAAEHRGRFDALTSLLRPNQAQQPTQPDPLDAQMELARRDELSLVDEWNALPAAEQTTAKLSEFKKRQKDIEDKKFDIAFEQRQRKMGGQRQGQGDVQQNVVKTLIATTYPDIVNNRQMLAYAHTEHQRLILVNGLPDDAATIQRAMEATRRHFGKGNQSRPPTTEQERSRFTGTTRGGGEGGQGPNRVTLSKLERQMARAAFPKLKTDQERYKAFARGKVAQDKAGANSGTRSR